MSKKPAADLSGLVATKGSAAPVANMPSRTPAAEDTTAAYTVTSETAVVDYQGQYAFSYSDRPDYNAMAATLKSLHLFKGTFC